MWWDCLSQHEQCHSLAVGDRKRCNETAFHKMCNVTHKLLVIGKDVMRLSFTKCAMSLTTCWSYEKMWWDCLSQNVQYHSLAGGHWKGCDETVFHKMCNVTHKLLAIGKDVMRLPFTTCASHSLAVGHRKRCDETALHKVCNVTHKLLVIGKDVMRLPFTKMVMSLTSCWS